MNDILDTFTTQILTCFKIMPFKAQHKILEHIVNIVLKTPLNEGELDFLEDHWLAIQLTDQRLVYYFSVNRNKVRVSKKQQPDVTFSGPLRSMLLLASKSVDPDTLFFQRKLVITGDTELGLQIKNMIDSLELDSLPFWLYSPLNIYQRASK